MKLKASAVAIVLSRDDEGRRVVLVGMRHPRSHFLGGFFAFPGGAHDAVDGELSAGEELVLRKTASRELFEETGVEVAPRLFHHAGRRTTPPFTPRGFDSLMLLAEIVRPLPFAPRAPEELLDLQWTRPAELLRRWRALQIRVAPPVLPIVHELAKSEDAPPADVAARLFTVNADMEADGPRIEFVPDVLMIPVRTATLPPATHTNCYFVGKREILILDPGCRDEDEIARLLRHARRRLAEGTSAKAVLLTHHHGDHVGGATSLARALGVPILAHTETLARFGPPNDVATKTLADGDVFELDGGERLRVLHTPGHAAGHLAFLEESQGSLFAGDLVSGVSTILVDEGPGELDRFLASLERIRDSGARTLFPGHGPPLIDPRRAVQDVLDHRAAREEKIAGAVRGGARELEDIVRLAYSDTPGADPGLARSQTRAHLARLESKGTVRRASGGWEPV